MISVLYLLLYRFFALISFAVDLKLNKAASWKGEGFILVGPLGMNKNNTQMKTQIFWKWGNFSVKNYMIAKYVVYAVCARAYWNNKENKILLNKTMIKANFTSSMSLKNCQLGSVVENDMNAHRLKPNWNYTMSRDKRSNWMQKSSISLIFRVVSRIVFQT